MTTSLHLLFLLLSLGSAAAYSSSVTNLQEMCDGDTHPTQSPQCLESSCQPATSNRTLALPLQLVLDTGARNWGPELRLYNTANGGCGLVKGNKIPPNKVILSGAACNETWKEITCPESLASKAGGWVHVEIVTEGRQVMLYFLGYKDRALNITCGAHLPSQVVVVPYGSRYNYSALTTNTTTPTTNTTTPTTNTSTIHPIYISLSVILVLVVVVVVVHMVLVRYCRRYKEWVRSTFSR